MRKSHMDQHTTPTINHLDTNMIHMGKIFSIRMDASDVFLNKFLNKTEFLKALFILGVQVQICGC